MLQEDEDITSTDKGKGKEREEFDLDDHRNSREHNESIMYPPISEDTEETRRVEENLRRWEVAERQRRKAARESSHSAPSLISDVSRRASLLFSGRRGKQNSISTHTALQSQDSIDVVPLTRAAGHVQRSPSPTRSEYERDPFANPTAPAPQVTVSPFDDFHAARDSTVATSQTLNKPTKDGGRSHETRRPPSPPRPLNLPPPRSPPPIFPIHEEERDNALETATDVRWWHDWLCGCSEGPDRGGDIQAGHTNPLE